MENTKIRLRVSPKGSGERWGYQYWLLTGALVALSCLSGSGLFAQTSSTFTYVHVIGTGDQTPEDKHELIVEMDDTIAACDVGSLTDFGLMTNVCSFDGDANSNGGVYHPPGGAPYRSFRREDPLPGQQVGFEKAIIPFGIPVLHPTTGDTYLTAFFDRIPGEDTGHSNRPGGRQKGVYAYGFEDNTMRLIADTTQWSEPLPVGAVWTDFSTNVAVSKAGAFFVGDYIQKEGTVGQGIFHDVNGKLHQIVADSSLVPGWTTTLSNYRAVAANSSTVLFVADSGSGTAGGKGSGVTGVFAYNLDTGKLSSVIESGSPVAEIGIFRDFAVEPPKGIFHNSIAVNEVGDIVLVADFEAEGKSRQGVFLLKTYGMGAPPVLVLGNGIPRPDLLRSEIQSFNTVAINHRSEIAFVAANTDGTVPEQGLIFYRNAEDDLRSVFKPGDSFLAELKHPSTTFNTGDYGALVSGSQALDSSQPPRIFFRHFYQVYNEDWGDPVGYSMMVLATLHE